MWQIAAVLAVLFSGGVYLPFDVSQPIARQNKILEKSGTKYLITNKSINRLSGKSTLSFWQQKILTERNKHLL